MTDEVNATNETVSWSQRISAFFAQAPNIIFQFVKDAIVSLFTNFRIFKINLFVGLIFFVLIPLTSWPGRLASGVLGNLFHDYSTFVNGVWFGFSLYAAVLAVMSSTCLGVRAERDWLYLKRIQHNPDDPEPKKNLPADLQAGDWLCFPIPVKTLLLFSLCMLPGSYAVTRWSSPGTANVVLGGICIGAIGCIVIVLLILFLLKTLTPKVQWLVWDIKNVEDPSQNDTPHRFRKTLYSLFYLYNKCVLLITDKPQFRILEHIANQVDENDKQIPSQIKHVHALAMSFIFGILGIYIFFFYFLSYRIGNIDPLFHSIPPAAFLYAVLTLLIWILALIFNQFSRHHFALLFLILYLFAVGNCKSNDLYTYDVVVRGKKNEKKQAKPRPNDVLKAFLKKQIKGVSDDGTVPTSAVNQMPTIIIVSASGGGILAAGWTTKVLKHLTRQIPKFDEHLQIISSVSGGSVGAAYYLAGRQVLLQTPKGSWGSLSSKNHSTQTCESDILKLVNLKTDPSGYDLRSHMHCLSIASSLSATAFGIAFPDLRKAFIPWGANNKLDRSRLLERTWRSYANKGIGNYKTNRISLLSDFSQAIRRAEMPAFIFNATVQETGERIAITPLLSLSRGRWRGRIPDHAHIGRFAHARTLSEFLSASNGEPIDVLRKRSTIDLWTAARVSATFAYASPETNAIFICRENKTKCNYRKQSANALKHLIDGGYHENYGVASAVNYLEAATNPYKFPFLKNLISRGVRFRFAWIEIRNSADNSKKIGTFEKAKKNTVRKGPCATTDLRAYKKKQFVNHCKVDDPSPRCEKQSEKTQSRIYFSLLDKAQDAKSAMQDSLGPIQGLWNGWSHNQRAYNDAILHHIGRYLEKKGHMFRSFVFAYSRPGPLSWHLSLRQKQDIDKIWNECEAQAELSALKTYLSLPPNILRGKKKKSAVPPQRPLPTSKPSKPGTLRSPPN